MQLLQIFSMVCVTGMCNVWFISNLGLKNLLLVKEKLESFSSTPSSHTSLNQSPTKGILSIRSIQFNFCDKSISIFHL